MVSFAESVVEDCNNDKFRSRSLGLFESSANRSISGKEDITLSMQMPNAHMIFHSIKATLGTVANMNFCDT